MTRRLHPVVCGLLAGLAAAALCQGQQAPRVLTDPGNDAVTRRTDLGNTGAISPATGRPDLLRMQIGGGGPERKAAPALDDLEAAMPQATQGGERDAAGHGAQHRR